jgi:hypothetical protein
MLEEQIEAMAHLQRSSTAIIEKLVGGWETFGGAMQRIDGENKLKELAQLAEMLEKRK